MVDYGLKDKVVIITGTNNLAETLLFLASEQARMLTGNVIKVSGGHAL